MDEGRPTPAAQQPGGTAERRPRWVVALALLALVAVVVVLAVHLAGGGLGGHLPAGER